MDEAAFKSTLAEREEALKRAWKALETIRDTLRPYFAAGSLEPGEKSFEEQANLLKGAIEAKIGGLGDRVSAMVKTGHLVIPWVGREPKSEKEREEMLRLKRAHDRSLCGIVEGKENQGFYPASQKGTV